MTLKFFLEGIEGLLNLKELSAVRAGFNSTARKERMNDTSTDSAGAGRSIFTPRGISD